jgi:O-methyltransferase domain
MPRQDATPGPSQRMGALLMGQFAAQCVHAVAVLGVADLLIDSQATGEALAAATGCHVASLQRVLRVLIRFGLFTETTPGLFQLTQMGATLRSDAPDSLRDAAIFLMSPPIWASCGSLLDTLCSGEPAFVGLHDATFYEYLAEHPKIAAVFNRFMTTQSNLHNAAVVDAYDFSDIQTLVDVGGGQGAMLAAVLRRYPAMKGILFDLPDVAASGRLAMSGFADRCEVSAGDMLKSVPAGGDAYIIKRVMMDRRDEEARGILRNCASAMTRGGKIIIVDPMLPSSAEPHPNWLTDMIGLCVTGGLGRTEQEFRDLFDAAGLTITRVIATRSPNFILEGSAGCEIDACERGASRRS